ncbi:hypothetical protein A8D95_27610 [Burkholderia cenocepacia]|uniref:Uncharacterized protein n=1 Tax=Burkholderia cenocepacia TaxID=95486 RepID=A0A1V2VWF3_9BURK|nr:hypothetical protein A8D83_20820 [Burkholderia cenocepacia]ONP15734.1 hypothetical protein A8D84_38790 [Burkholderia cenocepacia]ONP27506.1 hypothetical protein A8D85_37415 [Burkholderia cenocepacia]ONP47765.1 hypothetical protein A8D86_08785 [Burkholderia cenocepacia]ONP49570.1 hypothetical protein A8D87_15750 [Burkholderia cenocepacia]
MQRFRNRGMEGRYRTRMAMNSATGFGFALAPVDGRSGRRRLHRWRFVPDAGATRCRFVRSSTSPV